MSNTEDLDFLMEKMSSSLPNESPLDRKTSPTISTSRRVPPNTMFPPTSPHSIRTSKFGSSGGGPSSGFSFVSASDHISSLYNRPPGSDFCSKSKSGSTSDLSVSSVDGLTPTTTPLLGRRRHPSTSSEAGLGLSRSSSTLSLSSNTGGLPPLEAILKHVRDRIHGNLFSGWYTERRYVEPIDRYRDVVVVDATEVAIIKQVKYVAKKSSKILPENSFIGLTNTDDECKLYIASLGPTGGLGTSGSQASHPFGRYWFQICSINFIQNVGFCFDINVVRPFSSLDNQTCWQCRQRVLQAKSEPAVKIDSINAALLDMKSRLGTVMGEVVSSAGDPASWWAKMRPHLSLTNLWSFFKFLLVLLLALLAGLWSGIKQFANFMLKVLHELAFLVDRSTPFALGALNILSKVVGGFYLLVAMFWRDIRKPKSVPASHQAPGQDGVLRAALPPPRSLSPTPPQSRQRRAQAAPSNMSSAQAAPSNNLSAMDTMYSQGRQW